MRAETASGTRLGTRSGIAIRGRIARPVPSRPHNYLGHALPVGRTRTEHQPAAAALLGHRMRAASQRWS